MNTREEILNEAKTLITGDRAEAYGSYKTQMNAIACMFNALHIGDTDKSIHMKPEYVSEILMLLKMRRRQTSSGLDSSIDLCGYAALDAEAFLRSATMKDDPDAV